jgi:hypothetical protein
MMVTVTFTPVAAPCRCPKCEQKHTRMIFTEDYGLERRPRSAGPEWVGRFIVFCLDCEATLIAEWNTKVRRKRKRGRRKVA